VGQPEQSQSLVDRVLHSTRERILRGEYAPGARLPLSQLAQDAGVSTIPVREALRVLEAERLVETVPHRGPSVAELSVEDLNDLYEVRMHLEPEAIAKSKPLAREEAALLEAMLEDIAVATGDGDHARAMELHRSFHFTLYERSESGWRLYLIDLLWKHAERYQWLSLLRRHDVAIDEHKLILRRLEEGNTDEAAEALRAHLDTTRSLVEQAYAKVAERGATPG